MWPSPGRRGNLIKVYDNLFVDINSLTFWVHSSFQYSTTLQYTKYATTKFKSYVDYGHRKSTSDSWVLDKTFLSVMVSK